VVAVTLVVLILMVASGAILLPVRVVGCFAAASLGVIRPVGVILPALVPLEALDMPDVRLVEAPVEGFDVLEGRTLPLGPATLGFELETVRCAGAGCDTNRPVLEGALAGTPVPVMDEVLF
jgi:hypothetical protein